MTEQTRDPVALAIELSLAKKKLVESAAAVVECEKRLTAALGFSKTEGRETFNRESAMGTAKIVCNQPVNTSVDDELWEKTRRTLHPQHAARQIFKRTYKLDAKAARKLQDESPAKFAEVAKCISRKPGKIGVTIERLEITRGD